MQYGHYITYTHTRTRTHTLFSREKLTTKDSLHQLLSSFILHYTQSLFPDSRLLSALLCIYIGRCHNSPVLPTSKPLLLSRGLWVTTGIKFGSNSTASLLSSSKPKACVSFCDCAFFILSERIFDVFNTFKGHSARKDGRKKRKREWKDDKINHLS